MSLKAIATNARYIGMVTWTFEKLLKVVRFVGRKSYNVIADRPLYNIEITMGDQHIEVRENLSLGDLNTVLKAMKTLDHVTLIVRSAYEKKVPRNKENEQVST
tara:strand:- start:222 stop:530 length:309 start_codon:yes stop_codon:yes gene_type:complete